MANDYKYLVFKNKSKEFSIEYWDNDKEMPFIIDNDGEEQTFYLTTEQANELVWYLTKRLKEIDEFNQP